MCDYWWGNIPIVSHVCLLSGDTHYFLLTNSITLFDQLTNDVEGHYQLNPGVQSQYYRWTRTRGPYQGQQIFDPVTLLKMAHNISSYIFFSIFKKGTLFIARLDTILM